MPKFLVKHEFNFPECADRTVRNVVEAPDAITAFWEALDYDTSSTDLRPFHVQIDENGDLTFSELSDEEQDTYDDEEDDKAFRCNAFSIDGHNSLEERCDPGPAYWQYWNVTPYNGEFHANDILGKIKIDIVMLRGKEGFLILSDHPELLQAASDEAKITFGQL